MQNETQLNLNITDTLLYNLQEAFTAWEKTTTAEDMEEEERDELVVSPYAIQNQT